MNSRLAVKFLNIFLSYAYNYEIYDEHLIKHCTIIYLLELAQDATVINLTYVHTYVSTQEKCSSFNESTNAMNIYSLHFQFVVKLTSLHVQHT